MVSESRIEEKAVNEAESLNPCFNGIWSLSGKTCLNNQQEQCRS